MQTIQLETKIAAPPDLCFLLSLSIDLHLESTAQTSERAVAGVTSGLIGAGETVTWQGRHFGFILRHTSIISGYSRPTFFQDSMTKGMFKSFEHDHHFAEIDGGTLMRDELRFESPFQPLGTLVDQLILKNYFTKFLTERNAVIKHAAGHEDWRRFIPEGV
ncbi:ligand-binding SRPBCC domain-containing protein [Granulicella aggregans]|uniref:Ligand-binding SRPBCC domain-containing protein n=1 Tax=Granulicella aggregans TaxID=474949 RepID=A0A7W8E3M5_9BACT|nr:SRPBCC family protein [Granulicella aggregans]MBB5057379.1 ligand-binding SRPBCC domain-containing protein [Granulicella aggregans]